MNTRFTLDDLKVESFYTTEAGAKLGGTVLGYTDDSLTEAFCDCSPDESETTPSCIWYNSCDQACGDGGPTSVGCGSAAGCNPPTTINNQCGSFGDCYNGWGRT